MKNEQLTCKELIDNRFRNAGWNGADRTQVIEEVFLNTVSNELNEAEAIYGRAFSGYVLLGKNGKPLAVIEAKKTIKDAFSGNRYSSFRTIYSVVHQSHQ